MSPRKFVKRRNHEVMRAYLEQWQTECPSQTGVLWHWLLRPGEDGVLAAEAPADDGRAEADFAVEDYLYVPVDEHGQRDDALEDEFSIYEDKMILLCRSKSISDLKKVPWRDAILGCLSHGFRDRYGWSALYGLGQGNLVEGPIPAKQFESGQHKALVAQARSLLATYRQLIGGFEWSIQIGACTDLLVCDRPCWDLRARSGETHDVVLMPLNPRTLLKGTRGGAIDTISFRDVSALKAEHWELWNRMTVERARSWIVGKDRASLAALQPMLTKEMYAQRVSTDQVVSIPEK